MSYCMYLRKSRADVDAELHGEAETLARHEKTLLELAQRQSLAIREIYREIVSGETISQRPIMQKLLLEVENGLWDGVLVMEVERLARGDTVDQGIVAQTFKYSNTQIITPMKTYHPNNEFDEEYFEFGLFMSRREYKTINRRLQRGRISSVKEGKYIASQVAYGYSKKKIDNDKGYTLEPHPEEAEVIKMIYELYTKGQRQGDGTYRRLGVSLISRELNALRIKPKKANAWVASSIREILINPVYNGKIRWNWRPTVKKIEDRKTHIERPRSSLEKCILVNGLHEAIIDDETWEQVQILMANNPSVPTPSKCKIKNPLAGIVLCGLCGRRMVRRPYTNKKQADTLMCPVSFCKNVSSSLHLVEKHILDTLELWLKKYKIEWDIERNVTAPDTQIQLSQKALKSIENEISTLEKQLNALHDLLEQGIYTPDIFTKRSALLSQNINELKCRKVEILTRLKVHVSQEESESNVIPSIERFLEIYPQTNNSQLKNDLLKEIIEKIVYVKTVNARWKNHVDNFQIDIYPKIPNEFTD